MTLIIMAAGMGSRYGGLKQIDPIGAGGEFILDYSIYDALKAGFNKVVFVIKKENLELFRSTVGKRIEKNVQVEYAFQELGNIPTPESLPAGRTKPWGTAHAVLCSRPYVDGSFMVINADDFYGREAFFLLKGFLDTAKPDVKSHYVMAGYAMKNTLTEHGHVSRGVCHTNDAGYLSSIIERTKIQRNNGQTQYANDDGSWTDIDENTVVSMNCWGFTQDFFDKLECGMADFLADPNTNLEKSEYFLPFAVEKFLSRNECDVKVLNTSAKWHGVTYKEDKPLLVRALGDMIDNGTYPIRLWE